MLRYMYQEKESGHNRANGRHKDESHVFAPNQTEFICTSTHLITAVR